MVEEQNVPSQARRYQVTLEQPGTLTLELSSTAFALGLALFDADGKVLDLGSAQIRADTIRGGRYLTAGKYTVFVYTGNLRFGAFTLRSSFAQ